MPYEMKYFIIGILAAVYLGGLFISYRKYLENRQLEKKIFEMQKAIDSKNEGR